MDINEKHYWIQKENYERDVALLDLAASIEELSNDLNRTNLLDAVHVNENVHSRILRMILEYSQHGEYPFYECFLKIPKIAGILPKNFSGRKPRFFNERDRIDLLIEGAGADYAIIIENKIYNAVDQDRQMERYILSCEERGIRCDQIYALYLTSDGTKQISKSSLTGKAKESLGITHTSPGRFSEINFKYDLLPWLRDLITISKNMKTPQIESALTQYADYLAGMYGERECESEYKLKIIELFERHGIKTIASFNEHIDAVGKLASALTSFRDEYCQAQAEKYISAPLREYCKNRNIELLTATFTYQFLSIRISIPSLKKSSFCFNTEGDGLNIYGVANYDVNDGEILSEATMARFAESGFKRTRWWPAYRNPAPNRRQYLKPASIEFWEVYVPNDFVIYVKDAYEEVERILFDQEDALMP